MQEHIAFCKTRMLHAFLIQSTISINSKQLLPREFDSFQAKVIHNMAQYIVLNILQHSKSSFP